MSDSPRRRDLRPAEQAVGLGQVRVRLDGANPSPAVVGTTPLPGVAHFFFGDRPEQQYTNVPTYGGIRYQDVYPGIDLRYDGSTGQLKSTYVVAPGVDPAQIRRSWMLLGIFSSRLVSLCRWRSHGRQIRTRLAQRLHRQPSLVIGYRLTPRRARLRAKGLSPLSL